MMQWLIHILKSRYFLGGIGVILLVALIWMLGDWLGWSLEVRLLGIIAVLVLCVVALAVGFVRANRSSAAIEQSIKMQAEQQLMNTRPDRRAEIEELQEKLEASIEKLKQSKLGKGRRGRAALYALPWYMFIGPPGAGKTTAIANSGLNFPIGNDRVRGVGGTRNCDWFFSDSAILLDTAGRYMTEHEDDEEWNAFLDTLKEHRPDRPINGIIVGISVAELAGASLDEVEWHADRIRRRVDELIKRLGVRFPIYLVFTKCDLLQGFVEFFGEMSRREREQIWGCTLDKEQQESDDLRAVFEHEFELLYDALINERSVRLSRSMKREDRRKVYVFPLEFAAVKEKLGLFVSRLFQPNPYQESPTFRGFYFTSGTQEGAPIDRVIQSIAEQFELSSDAGNGFDPEMEAKSYFIKDVFTDVIVPDQYMVEQTSSAATKMNLMRAGIATAAVVLLGLFLFVTSVALVQSKRHLNRVEDAAVAASSVRWGDRATLEEDVARMDRLREEVEQLERRDASLLPSLFGLYRGGTVLEPAQALYYQKVQDFMQHYAYPALERQLQQAIQQGRIAPEGRDSLYEDLKAYLLLSSETTRLSEDVNRNFLQRYLTGLVGNEVLQGRAADPSGTMAQYVEQQVVFFIEGLREQTATTLAADERLIDRVRNLVYEQPSIASVYTRLKQEGRDQLPPLTLGETLQGRYLDMFQNRPEVSGFFTIGGWERFVQDRIAQASENPAAEDWVLNLEAGTLPSSMRNPDEMESELQQMYFRDYATEWQRFLESIQYRRFDNLTTAARYLVDLGNQSDSPLLYVLAQATAQTQFTGVGEALQDAVEGAEENRGLLGGRGRSLLNRAGRLVGGSDEGEGSDSDMHPVERQFIALHELKATAAASGGAAPALYQALESLARIGGLLDGMGSDPTKTTEFAARVLDEGGGDLASELRSIQSALSRFDADARDALFERPVRQAWSTVLAAAQQQLNDQWQREVVDEFQSRLAGQFPFDINADVNAPIQDFENFFRPREGVIAAFRQQRLQPFVTQDLRPRTWDGRGIQLSPSARAAFSKAEQIQNGLFMAGGTLRLQFEMQAELPERGPGAPPVDQVFVRIHGRDNTYNMGNYRPWVQFDWPGQAGASVGVSTQSGDLPPKRFDGSWALFRLLLQANVQPTSSAQYEVRWPFGQDIRVLYNLRAPSSSNPFNDPRGFFSFQCPEQLN